MYIIYIYVYVWFFCCFIKIIDDICIFYICICNFVVLVFILDFCLVGGFFSRFGVRNWLVRTCVSRRKLRFLILRRFRY